MPETGNNPNLKSGGPALLRNGYAPEYTFSSNYIITTIYSVSHDTRPKEVSVPEVPETHPVAGILCVESPERGYHGIPGLPFESGKVIPDPDWKRAICMPVSPANIPAGSKGIFRRILDPVRSGSLTSVLSEKTGLNPKKISEPAETCTDKQMELPRGKFRALKRNTGLLFLIRDLKEEAFTGYCKIQHAKRSMVLVFGNGTVLLAACDNLAGDQALDEICSHKYSWVDAMLHDLDDAQLQLALEFNPSLRVTEDPEFLSEMPEKAIVLPALHQREGGIELRDPHLETDKREIKETGFDPMENAVAEPDKTFTGRSASSLQEEESSDWKRALTMEIKPASDGIEILEKSQKEIETSAFTNLPEKIPASSMKFEPITSDSDLFERKALDLQPARTAAPERKEMWRSMRVNKLQNNSI